MAGNSLIEKSYKILFVIYAPIALLSYLISAFGGVDISFMMVMLLSINALSILFAVALIVLYAIRRPQIVTTADTNEKRMFLFRHDFLIPFIFISITSFTLLSIALYRDTDQQAETVQSVEKQTKIVLMLGLTDAHEFNTDINVESLFMDYGASELQGFSLHRKFTKDHGNAYDYQLLDHKMKYTPELEAKVKEYIKAGALYFVCTTSAIAVPLSKKFGQLVAESGVDNKPILICTNSASPAVETATNHVYRFYIRSKDEAQKLVEKAIELELEKITYIAVNSEYGKGAVDEFRKALEAKGGTLGRGLMLDPNLSRKKIPWK